jgi:serine-type D-Ala-D-Ala endopeptidase (penicillin-binding protein 7)
MGSHAWSGAVLLGTAVLLAAARPVAAKPAFAPRTADNLPNVQSASAVVIDLDTGHTIYAHHPDAVRRIASTGKVLLALLVRRKGIDLGGRTTITAEDRSFSRGGAKTKLAVGYTYSNHDLLRAMLIASDNQAPSALGRAVGLNAPELLNAINEYARSLGLKRTHFTDPSGLNGNQSTAREMATVLRVAMQDPVLVDIMTTERVQVTALAPRPRIAHYANTNRALRSHQHRVLGGKTGYTDMAGYCLLIAAEVKGRRFGMVLLGAQGKMTRYGDMTRVVDWIHDGMPNAALAVGR